jgi:type IV secretion system protein VirB2
MKSESRFDAPRREAWWPVLAQIAAAVLPSLAQAQGFDKVNTSINNLVAFFALISVGIVTLAVSWAGFKMVFQGARLADLANVLIGAAIIGGAAAIAAYLVN